MDSAFSLNKNASWKRYGSPFRDNCRTRCSRTVLPNNKKALVVTGGRIPPIFVVCRKTPDAVRIHFRYLARHVVCVSIYAITCKRYLDHYFTPSGSNASRQHNRNYQHESDARSCEKASLATEVTGKDVTRDRAEKLTIYFTLFTARDAVSSRGNCKRRLSFAQGE
ncbi:hypothetical protein [Burkholderia contaminans]|uniref:hypothetical protein n=1 Tax=Burkholderia contaminans TaxID=488447 RepID=UPI000F5AE5F4|nr:hypothetical protein [Burkholderia contaminans]